MRSIEMNPQTNHRHPRTMPALMASCKYHDMIIGMHGRSWMAVKRRLRKPGPARSAPPRDAFLVVASSQSLSESTEPGRERLRTLPTSRSPACCFRLRILSLSLCPRGGSPRPAARPEREDPFLLKSILFAVDGVMVRLA